MKRSVRLGSFLIFIFLLFALINVRTQTAFMQSELPMRKTAVSQASSQTVNPQSNTAVTVNFQSTNELIPDGSFEERPSLWEEQSSVPECPVLIAEWEPVTENPAYDGTSYSWGGGSCFVDDVGIPRDTMVSQMLTIPTDTPALSFRYWSERLDDDTFEDFGYIYLDNTEVWFYPLTQENNTNGWVEETLDLSDFAGQTVMLRFIVQHGTASAVGNLFIDFVEFAEPAAQTWEVTPRNGGGFSYTTASGKPIGDFLIPPGAVDKETIVYFKSASSAGFPLYPAPSEESPLGASLTFAGTAFDLEAFDEFVYLPFITSNGSSTRANQPVQTLHVESPTVGEDVNSFQFILPIKVRIHYDEAELEELGIEEGKIYLYYWTGDGWQDAAKTCDPSDWIDPSGYIRNFTDNWFELNVCHFSRFGTVG